MTTPVFPSLCGAIVGALPLGIVVFDDAGGIVLVNRHARVVVNTLNVGRTVQDTLSLDPACRPITATLTNGVLVEEVAVEGAGGRVLTLREAPLQCAEHVQHGAGVLGHSLRNPLAPLRLVGAAMRRPDADIEALSAIVDRQTKYLSTAIHTLLTPARRQRSNGTLMRNSETSSSARSVLIVDDNEDAARMLALMFDELGTQCTVVHTGESALDAMQAAYFDLAIVDIGLPDVSGLDVVRRARELGSRPGRIVGLSGYGLEQDRIAASSAGFDEYLVKPVAPQTLSDLLSEG